VQSARRLRVQALLYAFAFLVSEVPALLIFPDARAAYVASPVRWVPSAVSVATALLVCAATFSRRIPAGAVMTLGLAFEVVGSFGIATAQYLDGSQYATMPPWAGLSWVAVWVLGFAAIVPSPPNRVLVASLASVSSVPLTVGLVIAADPVLRIAPLPFFVVLVLPYLIVVVIAYVSARVIYGLGKEVARARELGSYRLEERLGQGGMGEVWRASHRLLARPAAVKLMRPDVSTARDPVKRAELSARFEREAQATASLRSPHTVELYDFGVTEEGVFYYVMELLDGFDCGTLVDRFGPVPVERAVHLLSQVCHSLGEAHAAGLTHRDIKPANVFVCRRGRDADVVKVLDFGLVKARHEDGATALDLTRDHAVRGTPAFMAPEQILGDRVLDGRADLYAMGCVGYWLVTGQRVFTGASTMDTLVQHAHAMPVPPSARTENRIPAAFDRLILDCLAKNPDDRPGSADVVSARLAAIDDGSAWTPERARAWWQANHPPTDPSAGDSAAVRARRQASRDDRPWRRKLTMS
jgi:serine/threonine-protein kinase